MKADLSEQTETEKGEYHVVEDPNGRSRVRFTRVIRVPQECATVKKAMVLAQIFSESTEYMEADPIKIQMDKGVHEIVGDQWGRMNVTCSHITFVGKDKDQTTIIGGFEVHNQQHVAFEKLTVKNPKATGLFVWGSETNVDMLMCRVEDCWGTGMDVDDGATVTATQCEFTGNFESGASFSDTNTKARLNDCTMHRNVEDGLVAYDRAVVNLHGTKTDIHSNKENGIHVYPLIVHSFNFFSDIYSCVPLIVHFFGHEHIHISFRHNASHDNSGEDYCCQRLQRLLMITVQKITAAITRMKDEIKDYKDYKDYKGSSRDEIKASLGAKKKNSQYYPFINSALKKGVESGAFAKNISERYKVVKENTRSLTRSYLHKIAKAITSMKHRKGSSRNEIKASLGAEIPQYRFINSALKKGVESGAFVNNSGRYKVVQGKKKKTTKKKKSSKKAKKSTKKKKTTKKKKSSKKAKKSTKSTKKNAAPKKKNKKKKAKKKQATKNK